MNAILQFSAQDIDVELAERAFYATSMDPQRRGRGIIRDYVAHMESVAQEFGAYADDSNREQIVGELERYRQGYVRRLHAYLSAHSRTASTFVTGASKFPVARNQKRLETSDRRLQELLEYSSKVLARLRSRYDPAELARRPIRATDDDAVEQLAEKIAEAEARQERMKAANRIVRRKIADAEKVRQLVELGIPTPVAHALLQPDYMGRLGYADYELKNNNANIRRMKARVAEIRALQADTGLELEQDGLRVYEEDGRVCIDFSGKPDSATRNMLKTHGFKWAPSRAAWVRQATQNGRDAARLLLERLATVEAAG